jgi:hypothetical protein
MIMTSCSPAHFPLSFSRLSALLIFSAGVTATMASAKTCRTYYDDARLQTMRDNLARYEWARQYRDNLLEGDGDEKPRTWSLEGHRFSVRRWAEHDDEFFWRLMPTTRFTKVYPTDRYGLSPRHGTAVRAKGAFYHPWRYDPINHPYQIQDPIDGLWYPSNNFGDGDMTSGDYPDDGHGMVYQGERYYPVREYSIATYLIYVVPLLQRMSQAYLLTGDENLAHKASILLARVADEFPNSTDKADRCQKGPWGYNSGIVTDYIWENFKLTAMALAYDALYDHIGQNQALVTFLQGKGVAVTTPQEVREYIEEHILRVGMQALFEHVIRGNHGHHQETAMTLALVMDDYDQTNPLNSKALADWCMFGEGYMAFIMTNSLFRDGSGAESPSYNTIRFDFINAARCFEQMRRRHPELYPADAYPDIFAEPKARAMFDHFIDIIIQDRFIAPIGDTGGGTLIPQRLDSIWQHALSPDRYLYGYLKYGDPRYARVLAGGKDALPAGDPFEPYHGDELLAAALLPAAQIREESRALDGYGVAILSSGSGAHSRSYSLNYSNHFQHSQYDNLSAGHYSNYVDLLPDLGYPYTWEYLEWDSGLATHNTVTVNEAPGKYVCPAGRAFMLAGQSPLQVACVAHDPYLYDPVHNPQVPPVDRYERTAVLVDVSPEEYYVLDLFYVSGGEQHDQSWHSAICPCDRPDLPWQDQPGTVAGPQVAQFDRWTDRWGQQRQTALSYLTHVSTATTLEPACFTWRLGLEDDNRLRLHIIPVDGPVELILSDGRSPARPPDWKLDYLFVRRQGAEGLVSRFVTLIDGRPGPEPTVQQVEVISREPLKVRVTHSGGVDELTLRWAEQVTGPFAPRQLAVTLQRGEQSWQIGETYRAGEVVACDYAANTITVSGVSPDALPGRYVRLYTDRRSSLYRVLAAEAAGEELTRLQLDQTPLLFKVMVSGFGEGRLLNSAPQWSWTAQEDKEGNLIPWRIWHGDAVIISEDGQTSYQVEGMPKGESVLVAGQPTAAQLQREFTDPNGDGRITASVYDYGPGSRLEVPEVTGP